MHKTYYIYILTNANHTVFYIGVTSDIVRRVFEHKHGLFDGFTKRYNVHRLVYFEMTEDAEAAMQREKVVKKWKRVFKIDAINRMNPQWRDLYLEMTNDYATTGEAPQLAALVRGDR